MRLLILRAPEIVTQLAYIMVKQCVSMILYGLSSGIISMALWGVLNMTSLKTEAWNARPATASEHLHQGHKEDTCLIRSASLWMNIKPRSGKKLDEWSRILDRLRFLTTKRNTDWYRHVWIDRWTQASRAGVTTCAEHSGPKGGLEETVGIS